MPNSDVVIGWVTDDGETTFHDRFASGRAPPSIDEEQNWEFVPGEEDNGFTILEFSRSFVTCDENDLPITHDTARVIWSFAGSDPTSEVLNFGNIHTYKGVQSINLLGGLPSAAPDPEDLEYYDVVVDEIIIPGTDTTYWCAAFRLPESIRNQTRYITKFVPEVTEGNEAHVHHLLVYLCDGLSEAHVGNGGDCRDGVANEVVECRGGTLIAAWAVGGEAFVYPDNVAFPFGGEGFPEYLVMELHYDNPDMRSGTVDSSGMRLWYTSTARELEAGILEVGHAVTDRHIIPPNSKDFTTTGIMIDECTTKFFPEEGIHVFANILHTHEVGTGLNLQHIRYNSECDVFEELEPIDRNLNYDFDFQQINHLPREVILRRGDILQLQCFYGTEELSEVTLGGLSTRDEMCLSFLFYYPKQNITAALSAVDETELNDYIKSIPGGQQIVDGDTGYKEGLNSITWDESRREEFQGVVYDSAQRAFCRGEYDAIFRITKFPEISCPYIAPDQCSDSTPLTCCERIAATEATTEATEDGVLQGASVALLLTLSLLAAMMG